MRLYLRGCLECAGSAVARVIEASDGVEALRLVRAGAVDVVICDLNLPRLDGHGLCDALRGDPDLRHIPVLLISGEDGAAAGGSDELLQKPFNGRQLRAAMGRAVPAPLWGESAVRP
jgi:CheY-like chemotaxis protein